MPTWKRAIGAAFTALFLFMFFYSTLTAWHEDHRSQCGERHYSSYYDACITRERPWEQK